jgi:hypothetical protein
MKFFSQPLKTLDIYIRVGSKMQRDGIGKRFSKWGVRISLINGQWSINKPE